MFDQNGFYHLTPKIDLSNLSYNMSSAATESNKSDKREKKAKEPKFKKGSWKHVLWKKLTKWKSSRFVEDFHFVKMENLMLYHEHSGIYKAESFKQLMKKSKLKKLKERGDVYVLINTYDDTYTKIPLESYLKLLKVDRIIVEYHLSGSFDGLEECDIYENTVILDNINDLLSYTNQHRAGINGVYDIQSYCCAYVDYRFKFRLVIRFVDGSVKTYKSDMNDFMKDFGLRPF